MVFPYSNLRRSSPSMRQSRCGGGMVVLYWPAARRRCGHEWTTHTYLAKQIAALMKLEFGGEFDADTRYGQALYFVPSDTLLQTESQALGITDEHQLFGGVVPHAFVATKTITHALPDAHSIVPAGWSFAFAEQLQSHVLPGFSAFDRQALRRASLTLLAQGSIRMKLPESMGGSGQSVIHCVEELDDFLHRIDEATLQRSGVVVEINLKEVETYSVGQSRVGDMLISYCGTQKLTRNNQGKQVYGGSDLTLVRGGFDQLMQLELDAPTRTAIFQACLYHHAALACYPGMIVSRANYDVARGRDDSGRQYSGVLEQSWRMGGATAAEVAALQVFSADPQLHAVCASTTEKYGEPVEVPADATIYYQGVDEKVGFLTKYSQVKDYVNPG